MVTRGFFFGPFPTSLTIAKLHYFNKWNTLSRTKRGWWCPKCSHGPAMNWRLALLSMIIYSYCPSCVEVECACVIWYKKMTHQNNTRTWQAFSPTVICLSVFNTGQCEYISWERPCCGTLHHLSACLHRVCHVWPEPSRPEGISCVSDWPVRVCRPPFRCRCPRFVTTSPWNHFAFEQKEWWGDL